jgi:tetratricopeptide (TPR) repeat protein
MFSGLNLQEIAFRSVRESLRIMSSRAPERTHGRMSKVAFLLLLLPQLQAGQFQVVGEIVSRPTQRFERVQIQSIDHTFVDSTDIDSNGRFSFKKIPEGLYKLVINSDSGREENRTIEVRRAFADKRGRVSVKIELQDSILPGDRLKTAPARLGVSPKAVDELQRAYEARGDVTKVRQHLEKAIEISPNFDEALNNLGTLYFVDSQFEQAADLFERALRANPNSFEARVNLGGALIALDQYDRALVENLKALEIRPGESLAEAQTGQSLFYLKRYEEALTHLEKSKQTDPMSFALPGLFIAQIRQIQGDRERAIAEYNEFLRFHPGHPYSTFAQRQIATMSKEAPR